MNKLVVMIVVMVAGFGFMHWRYSKMAARAHQTAEQKRDRLVYAKIERADFSLSALDNPAKSVAYTSCLGNRAPFLELNLAEEQFDAFCRCAAVHLVEQVHPLLPEKCRQAGRWDFAGDSSCKALDGRKPHQPQDRVITIMKSCAEWARAG
ncbi:MAG: hypothetical protein EOP11_14410 [Proteobacteria bacterium]|nr:MAG: hypothetical protein EOP11_14410 [Pseudomonadota bacterium]